MNLTKKTQKTQKPNNVSDCPNVTWVIKILIIDEHLSIVQAVMELKAEGFEETLSTMYSTLNSNINIS